MFYNVQRLINEIVPDEPDPAAANALQEGLGGQFGEMRTMMQYLFQSFNFRGNAKPYRDLMYAVGTEEISHVELMATTISNLLDGSPRYQGKASDPLDKPAAGGKTPLEIALHHARVDGRLLKCRLYEMTANKTARTTIAYLIVRDQAHENAYAKALETLGVNWGNTLPIPKTHAEKFPEVKKLLDLGLHTQQPHFGLDGLSELAKIFQGPSPMNDGTTLSVPDAPEGFPVPVARERFEEFSPGLDPALLELVKATAEMELAVTPGGATGAPGSGAGLTDKVKDKLN